MYTICFKKQSQNQPYEAIKKDKQANLTHKKN